MNTPNPDSNSLSRRDFISRSSLGAAAAYLAPATALAAAVLPTAARAATPAMSSVRPTGGFGRFEVSILEKWYFDGGDGSPEHMKFKYTPDEMATALDEMGLDLELTVRKVGHMTPEKAPDELPAMVAALAKKNRKITYLALDTIRPDEPHWQNVLRAAKKLGIDRYRHRGFHYDLSKPRKPQIADFTRMAREFAAFNRELGMQAVYQIHAQARFAGSAAWDLDMILDDIDPKYFGVAFDPRHVMVEQGLSWPNAVDILAPRTVALCVKSFKWDGDRPVEVPMGQGNVKKDIVEQVIKAHGGPLPIIIHIEHFKNGWNQNGPSMAPVAFGLRKTIVDAFRSDAAVLRGWLNQIAV